MPPTLLPDTSAMGAVSRDIRARADELRRHRGALAARCERAAWLSPAARAFRHRAAAVIAHLDACAHALDQAAGTLDRHANTVHRRAAELAAVPAGIGHAATAVAHGVEGGLRAGLHWCGI